MSKYGVLAGSADYEIHVQFLNADGTPADDLVAEDVAISYRRPGTNDLVSISLTDLTDLDDAHTDGGFKHAMGGAYRLCLPDAAIASGAPFVEVFGAGEGVVMVKEVVELRGYDHTDTPPEIDPQDIDDAKTAAQSADTKLGTPAGASVSADLAAVKSDTGSTKTRVEKALPDAVPGGEGGLPVLDENDLVHADTKRMNAAKVIGTGVEGDLWRGEEA